MNFADTFGAPACALIGMVHLPPLPGSPGWGGSLETVIGAARRDAERLVQGGCHGLLVENMGDVPYLKGEVPPETVAAMTIATQAVVAFGLPVGVQVLAAANREALGVAVTTGASFIRVEGFAYAHVADEGWIDACAGELLRTRAHLGAEVAIWADVQKKHSAHAVTADLDLSELAHGAIFCGADALIVTGSRTGQSPSQTDVRAVAGHGCPTVIGSGVTPENIRDYAAMVDAVVVGSALKVDGDWRQPVDLNRVRALSTALVEIS